MKTQIFAAALLIGCSTYALAADAVVEEVVVVDSAYDWSGVYLGVQAGYGWSDNDYGYDLEPVTGFDGDGFIGGLTVGANWQSGAFVYGVEADISYSDVDGSVLTSNGYPCLDEGCTADIEWFGTGRVRVGYAVDNFLPYLTGGFAVGRLEGTADTGACGMMTGTCLYDDTEFGWTAGLGIEWGLTQQISLKAEYLHIDFGTPDFGNTGPGSAYVDDITLDTVRIGVNYRF